MHVTPPESSPEQPQHYAPPTPPPASAPPAGGQPKPRRSVPLLLALRRRRPDSSLGLLPRWRRRSARAGSDAPKRGRRASSPARTRSVSTVTVDDRRRRRSKPAAPAAPPPPPADARPRSRDADLGSSAHGLPRRHLPDLGKARAELLLGHHQRRGSQPRPRLPRDQEHRRTGMAAARDSSRGRTSRPRARAHLGPSVAR
jgi:hypothetical protein